MIRSLLYLRFAVFYAAIFAVLGVLGPFWPLYLKGRGFTPTEVADFLAAASFARIFATPLIGWLNDHFAKRRLMLAILTAVALMAFSGFLAFEDRWILFALQVLAFNAYFVTLPLIEAHTVSSAMERGLDYPRIRLWGSVAFIAAAIAVGRLVELKGTVIILVFILPPLAVAFIASMILPVISSAVKSDKSASRPEATSFPSSQRRVLRLFRHPKFIACVAVSSILQGSHAFNYGFSTLHWLSGGISETIIAWLWTTSVLAEILLFMFIGRFGARIGVTHLFFIAAVSGIVRWLLLGATMILPFVFLAQALHAGTFACAHLATLRYIQGRAGAEFSGTALSFYTAIHAGLVMAPLFSLSGMLFETWGGSGYFVMAGVSGVGLICAVIFSRLPEQ